MHNFVHIVVASESLQKKRLAVGSVSNFGLCCCVCVSVVLWRKISAMTLCVVGLSIQVVRCLLLYKIIIYPLYAKKRKKSLIAKQKIIKGWMEFWST